MSLLILAILCLFIGMPVGLSLILRSRLSRQTEDPALTLHQQRLEGLERDRQAGLLDRQHYTAARIETERDIINHVSTPPESLTGASRAHRVIGLSTLLLVPLLALLLYAINGQPFLGPHPASPVPPAAFRNPPVMPPAGPAPAAPSPQQATPQPSTPQPTAPQPAAPQQDRP